MALVELRYQATVVSDLAMTWRDTLPALRELPEAEIAVPVGHPADDPAVVAEQGGTVVRIYHDGRAWLGIGDIPERTDAGIRLRVYSPLAWLDIRSVSDGRKFLGCTAGAIAKAALAEGLGGLPGAPVVPGRFCEAPPHIDEYEFRGQSVLQVLVDLVELTGQEFVLDEGLRLSWLPWAVRWRDVVLTDADGLLGPLPGESLQEQAREVHEVRRGLDWTVWDLRVPSVWPRRVQLRGER
jgi:hypothetical protein